MIVFVVDLKLLKDTEKPLWERKCDLVWKKFFTQTTFQVYSS